MIARRICTEYFWIWKL